MGHVAVASTSSLLTLFRQQLTFTMNAAQPPDPFASSPSQSGTTTPVRSQSPAPQQETTPGPSASSPNVPEFARRVSKAASLVSAASSSPPPTHRASFPDPSKEPKRGSSKLGGPAAKEGFCCDRDRDIAKGEEVSIVDAYKTTEGGKATYITYVIRLGVSVGSDPSSLHN